MITTPEEYIKNLWGIEVTNAAGEAENPYNNKPLLSIILPSDERIFDVDLNTRTISVPTFLSVAKDHRAETVYFLVDRYYEYKDLAQTSCMIEFINAAGEGGFYPVPFYDISSYPRYIDKDEITHEAKILIPWCIEGDVTKVAGQVQFVLRFYQLDDEHDKFIYNIRTQIATGTILNGMDDTVLDQNIDPETESYLAQQINWKIDEAEQTIYWTDLTPFAASSVGHTSPSTEVSAAYQSVLENSKK